MLAPAVFNDLAAAEQSQLCCQMQPGLAAKLARGSPGPSYSNNDSHDVTGIAPSSLTANEMASKVQPEAEASRSRAQASDDFQCSADSMHLHSASHNACPTTDHDKASPESARNNLGVFHSQDASGPLDVKAAAASNKRTRSSDLKKARMVWSEDLHSMFLRALSDIGLRHAVPKTIMQRMGVDSLSRENVASHLQKYRLALKRKAGLPDNTLMTAATWRQLEQAHEDFVASIPTATAAAPLTIRAAGPGLHPAGPTAVMPRYLESQPSPKPEPVTSATPKSLPPLPPMGASAQKLPPQTFAGAPACAPSGLPPGFTVPPPDSDGVAVGIPMPPALFSKDCRGPSRASHSSTAARPMRGTLPGLPSSDTLPPATGPSEPPLRPLGMPDAATALMPNAYPYPASDGHAVPTDGSNKLCTVYMYNPSVCGVGSRLDPGQARTLVKPAQVPQMLLSVSAAAYNSIAGGAAAPDLAGVVQGAPAQTGSTGSASRPASGGDDESTGLGKRRRRVSVRVRDFPGEQEASTKRPRSQRVSPAARAPAPARSTAQGAAPATAAVEDDWGGDCTALNMLAEIAGRLTEGQQL